MILGGAASKWNTDEEEDMGPQTDIERWDMQECQRREAGWLIIEGLM